MGRRPKGREDAHHTINAREDILNFFSSVLERRFSEAERSLRAIGEKRIRGDEFGEGYLNALNGIYLSLRAGDPRDFVNKILREAESLGRYDRAFRAKARECSGAPYDQGYFSAWWDFIRYYISSGKKIKAPGSMRDQGGI
ncbi:MAG: hypothetical protein QW486_05130 [Candidatus Bathyarchaeia archaeon]|nr:hypothetical protein [Candidatus Bathyarchaeota archaeon]